MIFQIFCSSVAHSQWYWKREKIEREGGLYPRGGIIIYYSFLIIRSKTVIVSTYIFKKTFNFTFQISNDRGLS